MTLWIDVKKGTKTTKRITIAKTPEGKNISISLFIARGAEDGPTLLINAAIHGNEHEAVEVVKKSIRDMEPVKLKGTVLGVPIVNLSAYKAGLRNDPTDNKDLNRAFPGNLQGSLTEQAAYGFFNKIARTADYIIDIHSAARPEIFLAHARMRARDPGGRTMKLINAFGTELIWEQPGSEGMLQVSATKNNIPAITIELGKENRGEENIDNCVDGVFNILKALGMVEGTARIPEHQILIPSQRISLKSPVEGDFERRVELGRVVEEGEVLGRIIDTVNEDETIVRSPAKCIVAGLYDHTSVKTGTRLFFLLPVKKARNELGIDSKHIIKVPKLPNTTFRENKLLKKILKARNESGHGH